MEKKENKINVNDTSEENYDSNVNEKDKDTIVLKEEKDNNSLKEEERLNFTNLKIPIFLNI